jgi:large subunit ribosomal protein L17
MRKGNKVKNLSRPTDQRVSMLRNLAKSLIISESMTTTQARARALSAYFDKLVNTAKKNTDASRRNLMAELGSEELVKKLVEVIAVKLESKNSGYCKKYLLEKRSGDNAQMSKILISTKK